MKICARVRLKFLGYLHTLEEQPTILSGGAFSRLDSLELASAVPVQAKIVRLIPLGHVQGPSLKKQQEPTRSRREEY